MATGTTNNAKAQLNMHCLFKSVQAQLEKKVDAS